MKYNIYINQERCLEWGLNLQQGAILSLFTTLSTWAEGKEIEGKIYYYISASKIIEEVPLITAKKRTILTIIQTLKEKGLLEHKLFNNKGFYALSSIGKQYIFNKDIEISSVQKNAYKCAKNDTLGMQKNAHNNNTNNPYTNNTIISKDIIEEKIKNFSPQKNNLKDLMISQIDKKTIIKEYNSSDENIKKEMMNFYLYRTEKKVNGKKERWQMEKTFDVSRRFYKWLQNSDKWSIPVDHEKERQRKIKELEEKRKNLFSNLNKKC